MRRRTWRIVVACACAIAAACGDDNYDTVVVAKMARISVPANLADDPRCQQLWRDLSRFGLEMDKAARDWNAVVLKSAEQLIELGCVKEIAP